MNAWNIHKKPTAIVTGGAGFIGSHMTDLLLKEGYAVCVIDNYAGGHTTNLDHHADNTDLHIEHMDIRNLPRDLAYFDGAQFVFHFAGIGDIVPSIEHPLEYMEVNVQGTARVLEAARHSGVKKLVYAASSSCYGIADTPTREDHPICPLYPYALSKYQGEQAVLHWHSVYDLPVNVIRIFNAYGTRVRTTGAYGAVFGVFFKQKLAGKPFTIVGDGTQSRDFIYVTDVVKAFYAAANTDKVGQVYNVGADKPQTVNRLVDLLGGERVYVPKRPGEPDCTWANIDKIKAQLNWHPTIAFKDGVAMMVQEINNWKDAPLWEPDNIAEATKTWFQYMGPKTSI